MSKIWGDLTDDELAAYDAEELPFFYEENLDDYEVPPGTLLHFELARVEQGRIYE